MKIELRRGCTASGLDIDDVNCHDVPKPEVRRILMQIISQVTEDDLYYILESLIDILGNYECDSQPCDQCGDTVETYTLEL